jgi:hypothetical protein
MAELRKGFYKVVTVEFLKEDGTAGEIDGIPEWSVDKADLAKLVPSADGMSVEVHYLADGEFILSVHADGDLGSGVFDLTAEETFTASAGIGAHSAKLVVGEDIAESATPVEPAPVEPAPVEPVVIPTA